ncbi:MAG TPA: hypothetical protein VHG72_13600 [Polyangia bacterium]|nr:hypothetical protein [Polyangia bacterium]
MIRWFALVGVAVIGLGCDGQPAPSDPTLDFAGQPALTVASASGALNIAVWWSPLHPTVGYDASQLEITDSTGAPVSGLALTIVPWMPAHGHGASVERPLPDRQRRRAPARTPPRPMPPAPARTTPAGTLKTGAVRLSPGQAVAYAAPP